MPSETLDRLIADALLARGDDEPFHATATRIFFRGVDELTEAEVAALEVVGFEAVKSGLAPVQVPVPTVERLIEAGGPYDRAEIDPEERPRITLIGFVALAAEASGSPPD